MANAVEAVAVFGSLSLDIDLCRRFGVGAKSHLVRLAHSSSKISPVLVPQYVTLTLVSAAAASQRRTPSGYGMRVAALQFWTAVACCVVLARARAEAEEGF